MSSPVTIRWRGTGAATGPVTNWHKGGLPTHLRPLQNFNHKENRHQGYAGREWIWTGGAPLITLQLADAATGGQVELQVTDDPSDSATVVTVGTATATGTRVTDNNMKLYARANISALTAGTAIVYLSGTG